MLASVFWPLHVLHIRIWKCVMSDQSTSNILVFCVKPSVNVTHGCVKHTASYLLQQVLQVLEKCRPVRSISKTSK